MTGTDVFDRFTGIGSSKSTVWCKKTSQQTTLLPVWGSWKHIMRYVPKGIGKFWDVAGYT